MSITRRAVNRSITFAPGDVTGEPVFVPRDANAAEGDGFVLAVVYRGNDNRSDLAVFDAQDVAKGPIATAIVAAPRAVRLPRQLAGRIAAMSVRA
jgi:carotenoid cleavage dioxygenase-like enzyme